jgi:transposase
MVEQSFHLDPFSSALFVFCNRNRDCLKILEWDGDGFWLHLKRLERGRFQWPTYGEDSTLKLSRDELVYLLENTKLRKKLFRKEVKPARVA